MEEPEPVDDEPAAEASEAPDEDAAEGDGAPPEEEEEDEDIYNLNILLPERLVGRKVARLKKGSSFGENGLHTGDAARRAATVVAATDRCLLLKLSRDDIQTEQDDATEEDTEDDDDDDEDPTMDENFVPQNAGALRRMSRHDSASNPLAGKLAELAVEEPVPEAEEAPAATPATRRRASTTLLGTLGHCPQEATIHVTLERKARKASVAKRKGSVARPSKKLKDAQAKDKALNPS